MDEHKRFLVVTPDNLRQNHLYIREHFDFFPSNCVVDGLNETITTDIARDAKTGNRAAFSEAAPGCFASSNITT